MSSLPQPTADLFIAHLGKPVEAIDADIFKYAEKPHFSLPEHSPIGGIFFKRLGYSITICPPDFYHDDISLSVNPPIITNVQIYSGDEYYNHDRCPHALPHGISFNDSREVLWEKLGPAEWVFPYKEPVKVERWDFDSHWLLVVYGEDMQFLRMVQIGLQPLPRKPSVLPKILQPDIHTLQSLFEKPWQVVAEHAAMKKMDFSELAQIQPGDTSSYEIDELKRFGIELYFRPDKDSPDVYIFTGARYIRRGVYFSKGFDGELPYGLRFSDKLETVLKKINRLPDAEKADELSGYYVWKLPEFLLHVGFSVMEQRVNRIRVAAHPYYSPELLKSSS